MQKTEKPNYGTSKRSLWLSSICAWVIIFILAFGAVMEGQTMAFATLALPLMVMLIAAMLGIHRGFGSMDMRTMMRASFALPSDPPFNSRDQPAEEGNGR